VHQTDIKLRAGDWVEVRSPSEIAETLDGDGTLDGLPFMPEMMEFCGRRLRVNRLAEKTCVEYSGYRYNMREFRRNNVVILEVPRCSGAAHDGCQRACTLFWKTAWLKKSTNEHASAPIDSFGEQTLRLVLKTMTAPGRYFCQSTQLDKATEALPRIRVILKCLYDIRSGSRRLLEMPRLILVPLFRYLTRYRFPRPLVGSLKQTPVRDLKLQSGEWVQVRSEEDILQTLDKLGRNRGLVCDRGFTQYAGRRFRVRSRLDRMISEATGEMRPMESTVILEGLNCICWWRHPGGCPREDFMYWREIWLEHAGNTVPASRDERSDAGM
jgi:hypothetical protein